MRRKSERNKAKGSPEKKIEKPTRRVTRRRGRASPVGSPERENPDDNVSSTPFPEEEKDARIQSEQQDKDIEKQETDISSSELIKSVLGGDEEDNGSVWKVARADASPGEIQKLKLCRQRNISEASDSSLSKKKSNKWPDSGEGGTEEADSADEQIASSQMSISNRADDPSSSHPGQDSNEEVSDYKENLPETTSANLSDDKTNIDQQAESNENLQETTTANLSEAPISEDNQSSSSTNVHEDNSHLSQSSLCRDNVAEVSSGNLPNDQLSEEHQENSNQPISINSNQQLIDANPTVTDECTDKNDEKDKNDNTENIDNEVAENNKNTEHVECDKNAENNKNNDSTENDENIENDEITKEASPIIEQDIPISEEISIDEPVVSYEDDITEEETASKQEIVSQQETPTHGETNSEIVLINNETNDTDFAENRKELENEEEETEEGEIREETEKEPSPDSDSASNTREKSVTRDTSNDQSTQDLHSSKRKHRKYHESSTSDAPESGDERSTVKSRAARRKEADSLKEEDNYRKSKKEKKNENQKSRSAKTKKDSVSANSETELLDNTVEKEDILEINEKSDDLNVSLSSKPVKVSLKRSFSTRLSTDSETKKEEKTNKKVSNETNQDKENHADNEQPDQKSATKRRRWGMTTTTDVAPAFSISTDSLKALVPGAKPLSVNEVKLTKDDDDEKEQQTNKNEVTPDHKSKVDSISKNDLKKGETKVDNYTAPRRKITIVKEAPRPKSPSPPEALATNILLIKNLVRPFTLNQIKELLSRTGTIVENGFWMDRIKSKCFVEYANEDQAFETRQALHGVSWPLSNPKKLIVEYATKEDMEMARETSKEQPAPKKTEPLLSADLWQQDSWSRDERPTIVNKITVVREWDLGKEDGQLHVKEKERERKEFEKKKRQRSRSPTLEAHLPAPARKFKKKEEEPPTAKLLDDLFRKTKATPCIYWLPLTNEQIAIKEEIRRQHMAEHARRLEEMRRAERSRDTRRRRTPRK